MRPAVRLFSGLTTGAALRYDARRMADHAPPARLLRTPLFALHRQAGARLVEFAGWELPVQYTSIIAEHTAVRTAAGLFDLSHMGRLFVRGPDALAFLQWVTVNDAARLTPGKAQYTLFCRPDGGVLDDAILYRLEDEYLAVVNAANRPKLLDWFERQRRERGLAVAIADRTAELAMIGLQGPLAQEVLSRHTDADLDGLPYYAASRSAVAGVDALIARTGYTGEDGFELIVPAHAAATVWETLAATADPARPALCGLGARDTLRLEAGMPLYGHELDEAINPYEAGLGRVVKLQKGEFVGRAALQRVKEDGPARRLVGFRVLENAVPRQGYELAHGDQVVGRVTSGTHSPTLKVGIGMALLRPDAANEGTELDLLVRGRRTPAIVVALPFVPHHTRRLASRAGA
jgi:aminomethyltransferase